MLSGHGPKCPTLEELLEEHMSEIDGAEIIKTFNKTLWFLKKAENMAIYQSKLWSFIVIYGCGMNVFNFVLMFLVSFLFSLFLIGCIDIFFIISSCP